MAVDVDRDSFLLFVEVRTAILDDLHNELLHLLFSQGMSTLFHYLFFDHLHLLNLLLLRGLGYLMLLRRMRYHLLWQMLLSKLLLKVLNVLSNLVNYARGIT